MRFLPFLILFSVLANLPAAAQVCLTEVMFNPIGPENTDEYIEIYNPSAADTLDLRNILIGDQDAQEPLTFPAHIDYLLPGQFAVIFDQDYLTRSNSYDDLIPAEALVLAVNDKTLGSGGLSNSHAETILIVTATGDTIANYTYSPENPPGISDEKIDLQQGDVPENWANSQSLNGTPGFKNSVSPKEFDLVLQAANPLIHPLHPRLTDQIEFNFLIQNAGRRPISHAYFSVALNDTLRIWEEWLDYLQAQGKVQRLIRWQATIAGKVNVQARIELPGDEDTSNNRIENQVFIGWPQNAVIINEIMFNPAPGEPEWVELWHTFSQPISLAGWKLRDYSGRKGILNDDRSWLLKPQQFAILTANESIRNYFDLPDSLLVIPVPGFPALNNNSETLALFDAANALIDSVAYQLTEPLPRNHSLERRREDRSPLEPQNWQPSRDPLGATPGRRNSISPLNFDLAIDSTSLGWSPEKPARKDRVALTIPVKNNGRQLNKIVALQLGLDLNEDARLSDNEILEMKEVKDSIKPEKNQEITLYWQPQQSGIFSLGVKVISEREDYPENNTFFFKLPIGYLPGDLVINEIMAGPQPDMPEWIEVYNPGQGPVQLNQWGLADDHTRSKAIAQAITLQPGGYAILASDSIGFGTEAIQIQLMTWPSLNNDRDQIILFDFYHRAIDSLNYVLPGNAMPGVSLERINPNLPSTDPANWSLSVAPSGATPGEKNSIFTKFLPAFHQLAVTPDPFSPDADGKDDFAIITFDLPSKLSQVNVEIYDLRGRRVRQLLNNAASGAHRRIIWDGRDDDGRVLRMGIYIIHLEAIDAGSGRHEIANKTLVLAKKL